MSIYAGGQWIVPPSSADSVGQTLAALRPTLVTGLFAFAPGELPSAEHRRVFETIRQQVRAAEPSARFDLTLSADAYLDGIAVVRHMRVLDEALVPDLWLFDGWDVADRENFAVVVSAIGQAHANGQAIGGITTSAEVPEDSDFGMLDQVDRPALQRRLAAISRFHPVPLLVRRTDSLSTLPVNDRVRAFSCWTVQTAPGRPGFTPDQIRALWERAATP
jgi:hypothetical protein